MKICNDLQLMALELLSFNMLRLKTINPNLIFYVTFIKLKELCIYQGSFNL